MPSDKIAELRALHEARGESAVAFSSWSFTVEHALPALLDIAEAARKHRHGPASLSPGIIECAICDALAAFVAIDAARGGNDAE